MFDARQGLYTARELLDGFNPEHTLAFTETFDFSVFRAFVKEGGAVPKTLDIRRRQAEHDSCIGDGLRRFLKAHDRPLVGIMGGHSVPRDDAAYRDLALLAGHLNERGYLIVTGGGPGIMEAAHFGVVFSGRNAAKFDEALAFLKGTPRFPDLDGLIDSDGNVAPDMEGKRIQARDWLAASLKARSMAEGELPVSLAIPTWLYGAEPTMPFASHYGKYFQNSIREEALVNNSRTGIVYGHGGGGTLREIFQDVELNFYAKQPKDFTPMIFFDKAGFWTSQPDIKGTVVVHDRIKLDQVVPNILRTARLKIDKDDAKVKECLNKIYFGDVYDDIDRILRAHAPTAQSNREFALNAQPLKVSISRINRA
ncbi:hypothetical protein AOQ73_40725 [Bradyrhizobium pachyrhizi]|uniref:hypothetical protein n=1 Tax=Bradyrhizobium pachyrhizi TaxID=280333 RepID=UPI0007052ECF|nr:hypothetical protein [Bradyrhizobium pachyrhizi]KRP84838.1 hypothetical protein AOQ73_40725 [Bradyrhizobium pachyrhizi]